MNICVLGYRFLPISTIFLLDFGNIPTVWYFHFVLFGNEVIKHMLCVVLSNQLQQYHHIMIVFAVAVSLHIPLKATI